LIWNKKIWKKQLLETDVLFSINFFPFCWRDGRWTT
jgi:hypothetical protein